jgi:beta-lactam-binding protein with PASTA domain
MIADPADPFGYVIGQSIYAGTQVEFGSSVTVYFGYSTTGG